MIGVPPGNVLGCSCCPRPAWALHPAGPLCIICLAVLDRHAPQIVARLGVAPELTLMRAAPVKRGA